MKKFFLFITLCCAAAVSVHAQKSQPGCSSASTPNGNIVFYGIDYSLVRFSYIDESAAYTQRVLPEINSLFITEASKYDVVKLMRKNVTVVDLDYAKSVANNLATDKLILNGDYTIGSIEVKDLIAKYPDASEEGVGLVFVAEWMNKKEKTGSYFVTFFDLKTKEVLSTCRQTGKTGGFGMRNFWATTVYSMMKNWN